MEVEKDDLKAMNLYLNIGRTVRRPYLNNHVAIDDITTLPKFLQACKKRNSIYFRPIDRVMPVKFFMGWSWGLENLQRHIEAGSFYEVARKDERVEERLKAQLLDCPNINSLRFRDKPDKQLIIQK